MKTIVQLLIAALVINASVQGARAAWKHYQLRDVVEQEARYGRHKTSSELHLRVIELAAELAIPLEDGDVVVDQRGQDTHVALSYIEPIELVPRAYTRQQKFDVSVRVSAIDFK
ncbi:MAG TPA: hypothetical protein VNJ02_02305 [Vicinamibacterales bacterium]|nr:hypothetical protein [Vicinamibacterales bacterium]